MIKTTRQRCEYAIGVLTEGSRSPTSRLRRTCEQRNNSAAWRYCWRSAAASSLVGSNVRFTPKADIQRRTNRWEFSWPLGIFPAYDKSIPLGNLLSVEGA